MFPLVPNLATVLGPLLLAATLVVPGQSHEPTVADTVAAISSAMDANDASAVALAEAAATRFPEEAAIHMWLGHAYRHRGQLLKHGIDISIPKSDVTTNIVPLIRVLEAIPVGVPDWAEGTSLYFEPRKLQGLKSITSESTRQATLKTVK